ncbi:MAG: hypothetical protein Q4F95_14140 [Oscillospiraceae bacterium]|nr:hypothetical protein [Oscillospiraceae bacterium]
MKKHTLAALITAVVLLAAAGAGLVYYFNIQKNSDASTSSFDEHAGMKTYRASTLKGLSLYVPDDYTENEEEYFDVSYKKSDARIGLTWEETDNDIVNYSSNAIDQYKSIADGFTLIDEHDEDISGTAVHVVEFGYMLSLDSGDKNYSCIAAYALNGKTAYVLTCTCEADNFSTYRDDFVRTYRTMQLVPDLGETQTS